MWQLSKGELPLTGQISYTFLVCFSKGSEGKYRQGDTRNKKKQKKTDGLLFPTLYKTTKNVVGLLLLAIDALLRA